MPTMKQRLLQPWWTFRAKHGYKPPVPPPGYYLWELIGYTSDSQALEGKYLLQIIEGPYTGTRLALSQRTTFRPDWQFSIGYEKFVNKMLLSIWATY